MKPMEKPKSFEQKLAEALKKQLALRKNSKKPVQNQKMELKSV